MQKLDPSQSLSFASEDKSILAYHSPISAPGCYGSALTFKESASECIACIFKETCKPQSEARLEALRAKFGIKVRAPVTRKRAEVTKTEDGTFLMTSLPRKIEDLVLRIERAGIDVSGKLSRGENPFEKRPFFLRITCHLLLNLPNGIERKVLQVALQRKLNWTEGTAVSQALQASQLLQALGVADEINGCIKLRKNL